MIIYPKLAYIFEEVTVMKMMLILILLAMLATFIPAGLQIRNMRRSSSGQTRGELTLMG
jgi:hypothetical protein